MNSELIDLYRSMNVNHLLDDELEYELALRRVEFSSGESRDIKRRKLRNAMKEERESNSFISRKIVEEARDTESRQVEEKIAMIRDSLENKKVKKTDFPQLETRLVHLYFRLFRLRKVFNTDGLKKIAQGLLNDYFSRNSRDPEVIGEYSGGLLNVANRRVSQRPSDNKSDEEVDSSSNPRTGNDDSESSAEGNTEESEKEENSVDEEEFNFTVRNTRTRRSSTPKRQEDKAVDVDELVERIMLRVDTLVTSKLKALKIGTQNEKHRHVEKRKNGSKESKQIKNSSSQRLMEKHEIQPKIKGEQRDAKVTIRRRSRMNSESSIANRNSGVDNRSDSERAGTDTDRVEDREIGRRLKRRPRPVCDWKLKYDGKDDGRGLNKFVSEVEFMAEAENISKQSLFNEAIHLFSGDARAWYIEGKRNREFRNWAELVAELKLEFQPPDMDYHYEQQAAARRQKRGEKFQDYYNAIKEIFEQMAVPPTEHRRFDIIFRNLRSDYKNSLLVKGVRTLRMLKVWGRKLDSANWFLYRKPEVEQGSRSSQVHEINSGPHLQTQRPQRNDWRDNSSRSRPDWRNRNSGVYQGSRNDNKGPWKPAPEQAKTNIPKPKSSQSNLNAGEGTSKEILQKRIEEYRIPERTVCFNCRGNYHHSSACLKAKEVFCTTCGFQGFRRPDCPFCAKNGKRSM